MQVILTFILCMAALFIQTKLKIIAGQDILFPLLIALIVKKGPDESIFYSFGLGFLQDSLIGIGFVNTFIKTSTSIIASYLKNIIVLDDNGLCMVFAAIFTPLATLGSIFSIQIFQNSGMIGIPWFGLVFSTAINIILAPLFYLALSWIDRDGE